MFFTKKRVRRMTVDRESCQTVGRYMFRLNTSLRSHQALVTNIAYIEGRYNTLVNIGILILELFRILKPNFYLKILCSVDRAFLYNLFQMKPTRCTLILSIFISTSIHVSGNYVSIIRRTYCI